MKRRRKSAFERCPLWVQSWANWKGSTPYAAPLAMRAFRAGFIAGRRAKHRRRAHDNAVFIVGLQNTVNVLELNYDVLKVRCQEQDDTIAELRAALEISESILRGKAK